MKRLNILSRSMIKKKKIILTFNKIEQYLLALVLYLSSWLNFGSQTENGVTSLSQGFTFFSQLIFSRLTRLNSLDFSCSSSTLRTFHDLNSNLVFFKLFEFTFKLTSFGCHDSTAKTAAVTIRENLSSVIILFISPVLAVKVLMFDSSWLKFL